MSWHRLLIIVCLLFMVNDSFAKMSAGESRFFRNAYKCSTVAALSYARQEIEPAKQVAEAAFYACRQEWRAFYAESLKASRKRQMDLDITDIENSTRRSVIEAFSDNIVDWRAKATVGGDGVYEDLARRIAKEF